MPPGSPPLDFFNIQYAFIQHEETIHAKDASPLVKLTLKAEAAPREDLSIMRVFMLGCVGPRGDDSCEGCEPTREAHA